MPIKSPARAGLIPDNFNLVPLPSVELNFARRTGQKDQELGLSPTPAQTGSADRVIYEPQHNGALPQKQT